MTTSPGAMGENDLPKGRLDLVCEDACIHEAGAIPVAGSTFQRPRAISGWPNVVIPVKGTLETTGIPRLKYVVTGVGFRSLNGDWQNKKGSVTGMRSVPKRIKSSVFLLDLSQHHSENTTFKRAGGEG